MSAVPRAVSAAAPARIALLGTGNVGSAVRAQLQRRGPALALVAVANTRECHAAGAAKVAAAGDAQDHASRAVRALGTTGTRIVIDATASEAVAARHAAWLGSGLHVVTACKLGQGARLARWRAIAAASARAGTRYGDSATVGAGLPLLRSLRDLRDGGDRIEAIAGVLSGSLAWLLAQHDGTRPFAELVAEAAARGYTEPDPREDLSGEDVRRKLLILARAAGVELEQDAVQVAPIEAAAMEAHLHAARAAGKTLAYVARLDRDAPGGLTATARLECLEPGDPLAQGAGTDNRVAIWCDRYRARPLVIQGPGAGAEVTAAALLDDALRIARRYEATGSRASDAR